MTEITEVYRVTRSRAPARKGYDKHGQVLAGKFRVKTIVAAIKAQNTSDLHRWQGRSIYRTGVPKPTPETFTVERAEVSEFTDVTGEFS